jgi:hypothetical protein
LTLLGSGFLGYGIDTMITVCCFVTAFHRERVKLLIWLGVFAVIGLWFAPIYMGARSQIRAVVWGDKAADVRVSVTKQALSEKASDTAFDFDAFAASIDGRLNYDTFIGLAQNNFKRGPVQFAEGETIWNAMLALIPRAIWPEKPIFAGSGDLVSRFTGKDFGKDTSVGIGHIMEIYVNFGPWGLLIGFTLLGAGMAWADYSAAQALEAEDFERFLIWFLSGQAFLMAGGVLAECPPAAVGAIILTLFITRYACSRTTAPGDRSYEIAALKRMQEQER